MHTLPGRRCLHCPKRSRMWVGERTCCCGGRVRGALAYCSGLMGWGGMLQMRVHARDWHLLLAHRLGRRRCKVFLRFGLGSAYRRGGVLLTHGRGGRNGRHPRATPDPTKVLNVPCTPTRAYALPASESKRPLLRPPTVPRPFLHLPVTAEAQLLAR